MEAINQVMTSQDKFRADPVIEQISKQENNTRKHYCRLEDRYDSPRNPQVYQHGKNII